MKMKEIIPIMNHRLLQPDYLNREESMEIKRKEICKKLIASGVKHHKAYEISKRRMKI